MSEYEVFTPNKHRLIDRYFPVLDHGFIALKDFMGSDSDIEEAARVSYGKENRKTSDTRGLLRYLMKHQHTSPFEMAEVKLHVAMPIFVARQWIRHRTANVNEFSGRYSVVPSIFHTPDREHFTKQSENNKQGRNDSQLDEVDYNVLIDNLNSVRYIVTDDYKNMIDSGIAKELARINHPLATYTYWYWKCDLHNLFHFLKLRLDEHAQYEVRVYAEKIAGMLMELFPLSWEAFQDYKLNAETFSATEVELLQMLVSDKASGIKPGGESTPEYIKGVLKNIDNLSQRELTAFETKLLNKKTIKNYQLDHLDAKDGEYFRKRIEESSVTV